MRKGKRNDDDDDHHHLYTRLTVKHGSDWAASTPGCGPPACTPDAALAFTSVALSPVGQQQSQIL